jgi:hypothetical protein
VLIYVNSVAAVLIFRSRAITAITRDPFTFAALPAQLALGAAVLPRG